MNALKSAIFVAALSAMQMANALIVNGTYNAYGFDTVSIIVPNSGEVSFEYLSGSEDSTLGLFDGTGRHLISNDDWIGTQLSYMAPTLSAGSYTLVIAPCCEMIAAINGDSGVWNGRFLLGGSATLASVTSYMRSSFRGAGAGEIYSVSINGANIAVVPEPEQWALFALGMVVVTAGVRRRR